ncbi:carbohydrate ABC transporter membrane protein 2 (CUT1 family) [Hydrogenispora ethanolica]|uniref:Carbohydrate ABC transporter membrane protein 2 (CUT1 family) n=1 Tax=Hydrogenispora ethanolica TaxID=1082276 RepID=A0A4R1SA04_HYDET|nr:carbohydrate ABC transporter permease [Hydrogenispora ethanolica]TCL76261.1 carbohydrate ABC transporter membrane protein 2 (CUT1 family) [Hydrogenispora ethanolica]
MKKLVYLLPLAALTIVSIVPFYVIVMMATHSTPEIFSEQVYWPGDYFLENMKTIFRNNFQLYYLNSIIVSTASTLLSVYISALTGYALAKYNFRLKKAIFYFILATMMIPGQIGLIGYVVEMRALRLTNTLAPLILVWCANAFGVFFMMQYILETVPGEIIESARIDGCGEFSIFNRIALPFMKPALATLAMLIFLWSWNNYLLPLILTANKALYTVPLGIQALQNYYVTDFGARGAGLAFAVLPVLLIFIIGSKSFIKGLTAGAVKG